MAVLFHFSFVSNSLASRADSLFLPFFLAAPRARPANAKREGTKFHCVISPLITGEFMVLLYTDKVTSPLITGVFSCSSYIDRVISPLIIGVFLVHYNKQTEISRRWSWSPASFWCLIIYRQSYLAVDQRRVFETDSVTSSLINDEFLVPFFIQTELSRRWSPTSFWCLIIYRQRYLAVDQRPVFGAFLYTDRVISPLIIGEFLVPYNIQTELSRRWSSASFWCLLYTDSLAVDHRRVFGALQYTDRVISPLIIGEFLVPYARVALETNI